MMKKQKTTHALLAAVLSVSMLAACSSEAEPAASGDAASSDAAASTASSSAATTEVSSQAASADYTLNEEGSADLKATGIITYSFGEEQEEAWADNITAVYLREAPASPTPVSESDLVAAEKYTISTIKMMLDSDLFPLELSESKEYEVTVQSTGYDDYHIGLTVNNRTPTSLVFREIDSAGNVLNTTELSYDDVAAMCTNEEFYSIGCVMHGLMSVKAEGVYLEDLFEAAGVTFGPGMSLALRATDIATSIEATETYNANKIGTVENPEQYWMKPRFTDNYKLSYEELFGKTRYFITSVWEDEAVGNLVKEDGTAFNFEAREALVSNPEYMTEVKPMLALKYGYTEFAGDQQDIRTANFDYYDLTATERAFRLLYGLAMDDDPTVNVTAYNEETKEYPLVTNPEYTGRSAIEEGPDPCGITARTGMLVFGIDIFVDGE